MRPMASIRLLGLTVVPEHDLVPGWNRRATGPAARCLAHRTLTGRFPVAVGRNGLVTLGRAAPGFGIRAPLAARGLRARLRRRPGRGR